MKEWSPQEAVISSKSYLSLMTHGALGSDVEMLGGLYTAHAQPTTTHCKIPENWHMKKAGYKVRSR